MLISIHALLAESDRSTGQRPQQGSDFYPRSPCGERRTNVRHQLKICAISIHALLAESDLNAIINHCIPEVLFLSTLSLRRATARPICGKRSINISIHALLAESDHLTRTATQSPPYFYPRSPCGERQPQYHDWQPAPKISIHALLAESDW